MGILDRKYSRRDDEEPPSTEEPRNRWIWIGLALLIPIAIAVVMLTPDNPRSLEKGSRLVNINTATTVELESLPGIGPSLARLVIAGRPYQSVDDLAGVSGIGPRQVNELRPMLTTTELTRDIRKASIWQRVTDAVVRLNAFLLTATGIGLLAGVYFLVKWLRRNLRRISNAQVRSSFEDAERRRWEGHRREK
ncbi:MAG TPA: ComEA family DNA-binding protein [Burkholderiales bacterium]|nr:ComEA family DNA-binding protein [Burkholderiales bacterium]